MAKVNAPDRTRDALLNAAKKLFALRGYDGTSVKELAQLARCNVSLVSYHFKGKEGLYRACLEQFGRTRLAAAERILSPAQPTRSREEMRTRLAMFVEEMIECHVAEPELSAMVHRECEQALPRIPDIFEATFLEIFRNLMSFFKSAQRRGLVRGAVDARLASVYLFGAILHLFRSDPLGKKFFGTTIRDPRYRAKAARNLVDLFVEGVAR
ncbi:MAG: TetR/AcrR family transcriptional regulator [Deltaproteobacteria bacterium]|nr:TetR/AcrR family transcriptional regulator [Deltaproteobacteria bacterium]